MTDTMVAVLGGGISGCVTACLLADRGVNVAIVEQREMLMDAASRWNDGKIHLGYTFTGTSSVATAALMQAGAGVFVPTMERVLGVSLESWLGRPTAYVVDAESLIDLETLWQRASGVGELLTRTAAEHPGLRRWLDHTAAVERLAADEATSMTGQRGLIGGWRTTERHVSTGRVAEALRAAVSAREITVIRGRVTDIEPVRDGWFVRLADGRSLTAAVAVNCLWENRAIFDRRVAPESAAGPPISIRYKHCVFGTGAKIDHLWPSTRILGPFGDIAMYPDGDAYLSWYPAALAGRSDDGYPPVVAEHDADQIMADTIAGLGLPADTLSRTGAAWVVRGGFIVAHGSGDVDQLETLLHTRDRPAAAELRPGYVSVDTGKYTLGPLLASRAADLATRRLANGH